MATVKRSGDIPTAKAVTRNPSPQELRALTAEMPNAKHTIFDNYNVQTKVVARSNGSTFIATDTPERHPGQTVTKAEAARLADMQDDYIRSQEMLVVDGSIGNHERLATPARLMVAPGCRDCVSPASLPPSTSSWAQTGTFSCQLFLSTFRSLRSAGQGDMLTAVQKPVYNRPTSRPGKAASNDRYNAIRASSPCK